MKGRLCCANKAVQDLNYKPFNNFFVAPQLAQSLGLPLQASFMDFGPVGLIVFIPPPLQIQMVRADNSFDPVTFMIGKKSIIYCWLS